MSKSAARIPLESLIPDGEVEPDTWVRSPLGDGKSHYLYDGVNALCGRSIPSWENEWVQWAMEYGQKEWYRAYETRTGGHCGPCKTALKDKRHPHFAPAPVWGQDTRSDPIRRRHEALGPAARRAHELAFMVKLNMIEEVLGDYEEIDE